MSFSPLPVIFLTDLSKRATSSVVELGCGDGRLTASMLAAGAAVIAVDGRRCDGLTLDAGVIADVTRPPITGAGMIVAANLLRHLWDGVRSLVILSAWCDCLAPGGCLYILEDEPAVGDGPAGAYRDSQDFLARVISWRRGLLPRADFERVLAEGEGTGAWVFGSAPNTYSPPDPATVLAMLTGAGGAMGAEAEAIAKAVSRHGISYGDYWWARCQRMGE